jgi:hypothetical protein
MTLIATDAGTRACGTTSFGELLGERLRTEQARLLRASVDGDDLQIQISQAEIDDLRALAARNDIDAA